MFGRKKLKNEPVRAVSNVVVGTGTSKNHVVKKLGVFAFAIILVVTFGLIFTKRNQLFANQCQGKADSVLYDEAQVSMTKLESSALEKTVEKIKKQKDFVKDANCLYPLVVHYIRENDAENAQRYYAELQLSFDETVGIAKAYGATEGRTTVKDMAIPISGIQKQKERMNESSNFPSFQ